MSQAKVPAWVKYSPYSYLKYLVGVSGFQVW